MGRIQERCWAWAIVVVSNMPQIKVNRMQCRVLTAAAAALQGYQLHRGSRRLGQFMNSSEPSKLPRRASFAIGIPTVVGRVAVGGISALHPLQPRKRITMKLSWLPSRHSFLLLPLQEVCQRFLSKGLRAGRRELRQCRAAECSWIPSNLSRTRSCRRRRLLQDLLPTRIESSLLLLHRLLRTQQRRSKLNAWIDSKKLL